MFSAPGTQHIYDNAYIIVASSHHPPGSLPTPLCFVSKNIVTGKLCTWTCHSPDQPPVYTTGQRDLVIAFSAEEVGKCIIRVGWVFPRSCIDLHALFRCETNHFGLRIRSTLVEALEHFNLPGFASIDGYTDRAILESKGPYSAEEIQMLVKSCIMRVECIDRLLPRLLKRVSWQEALLMGRYTMTAVPLIQYRGIPVNHQILDEIVSNKERMRTTLIEQLNKDISLYVDGSFSESKFTTLIHDLGIRWPRTPTGKPRLDKETFKEQTQLFPILKPVAELRATLAAFGNIRPTIGPDGRSRTAIRPFASITGRNQPSTAMDIYSWPKWARHLIRPPAGRAILTLDYEQQEFLTAAALSGDTRMLEAYRSGDPYLETAKRVGRVPADATKFSHSTTRDTYKTALLAIQYHCGEQGLATRVGGLANAKRILEEHKRLYSVYHRWSRDQIDRILLGYSLSTPFGWTIRSHQNTPASDLNPRSIANWSVQAAGGDILRIATMLLVERGFHVIAPIHDAIVIECDLDSIKDVAAEASKHMRDASSVVLGGEVCRVESREVLPSHDIMSDNVPEMFTRIMSLLPQIPA